jgi:hypothetical protein
MYGLSDHGGAPQGREEVRLVVNVYDPPYWLVIPMEWPLPGAAMGEAAYAIAPPIVPRDILPRVVSDVFGVADVYAERHPGQRTVWFTDLTRWMDEHGTSWAALDVDWADALEKIPQCPTPRMYLTINERAHGIICDASRQGITFHHLDGTSEQITPAERDHLHHVLEDSLTADWAPYVRQLQTAGKLLIQ